MERNIWNTLYKCSTGVPAAVILGLLFGSFIPLFYYSVKVDFGINQRFSELERKTAEAMEQYNLDGTQYEIK